VNSGVVEAEIDLQLLLNWSEFECVIELIRFLDYIVIMNDSLERR